MFTFFHRKNKVVIDCFTSDSNAYEYAPIIRGTKAFPDWWKNLKKTNSNNIDYSINDANMKNCYGFSELFKRSIIIPFWTDLHLKVTPNDGYQFQVKSGEKPVSHNPKQYKDGFQNYYHIKLKSPWILKEKTGIHFAWFGSEWNIENNKFKILPGCIEYRVNRSTHINMMIPKEENNYFNYIEIGQPLVHMIPLNDCKIDIRNHLVTNEEIEKISCSRVIPSFKGINKLIDMKNKKSKCPFHF